jgi:hypothetical protein
MKTSLMVSMGLGLLIGVVPLLAHHSFAAEYDSAKPVTVKGVITKVAWVNPHSYLYVSVKDASGNTAVWAFETSSPNALERRGWTRHAVKEGDQVTIEGYRSKDNAKLSDGSIHANARSIIMADGRKVFAGSSADDGGPPAK